MTHFSISRAWLCIVVGYVVAVVVSTNGDMVMGTVTTKVRKRGQAKRQSRERAQGEMRTNQEEEPTDLFPASFSSWISLL